MGVPASARGARAADGIAAVAKASAAIIEKRNERERDWGAARRRVGLIMRLL
jgi:hypothetical protein